MSGALYYSIIDDRAEGSFAKESSKLVGFPISFIEETENYDDGKFLVMDTGVCLRADKNHYLEIVPTQGLTNKGYMMVNSPMIISTLDENTIKITLMRFRDDAVEMDYPEELCRVIVKARESGQIAHPKLIEDLKLMDSIKRQGTGMGYTNYADTSTSMPRTSVRDKRKQNRGGGNKRW